MNTSVLQLLDKLTRLEQEFASNYGAFSLFALMLREEANDRWDLVVSATWLEQINTNPVTTIFSKSLGIYRPNHDSFFFRLGQVLTSDELIMLSRVVTLAPDTSFVQTMNKLYSLEHAISEFTNLEVDGVDFKRGYVITSQSTAATMPQQYAKVVL